MNEDIIYLGEVGDIVSDNNYTYKVLCIFNNRKYVSVVNTQTGFSYDNCTYKDFPGCSLFGREGEYLVGVDLGFVHKEDSEILQDINLYF